MTDATKIVLRRMLAQALQAGQLSIEQGVQAMREIDSEGEPSVRLYMFGCASNQPTGGVSWSNMSNGISLTTTPLTTP